MPPPPPPGSPRPPGSPPPPPPPRTEPAAERAVVPAHEFRVEVGSHEFVPPTAPGGVRYPLPSGASAVLFDPRHRPLRLPSAGGRHNRSSAGGPAPPPASALPNGNGNGNGAAASAAAGAGSGGGEANPPRKPRRGPRPPLSSWREEWQSVRQWWSRARDSGARRARERSAFDWASTVLPCLSWLRVYNVRENLVWDVLAGVSVGFMIVPQSMSYANLAGLAPQYGLYASLVPLVVYAVFGERERRRERGGGG